MAIAASRRGLRLASESPARHVLFLALLAATGFLAIAISGAISLGLRHASGQNAIAGDTLSAHLSPARCADLLEYYPGAKDCASAELSHHADEIVFYRLAMAMPALGAFIAYEVLRRAWQLAPDERRSQRQWHAALGLAAFGLAALVLVSLGFANIARGESAGTARWLSDGGTALAFCALYATYARGRSGPAEAAPASERSFRERRCLERRATPRLSLRRVMAIIEENKERQRPAAWGRSGGRSRRGNDRCAPQR